MDIGYLVTVLGIILVSMTFHEAMHGFMAYLLGDDTAKAQGRLTLNPIKHIDPFMTILLPLTLALIPGAPIFGGAKPVQFNPNRIKYGEWGIALVGLAGPLTNFLIAFVTFGIFAVTGANPNSPIGSVMLLATNINLGFFVFNMLPIPPLDGSRVLYALAPDVVRRGMDAMERGGLIVIFAIVLLGNSIIGSFIYRSTYSILGLFAKIFGLS